LQYYISFSLSILLGLLAAKCKTKNQIKAATIFALLPLLWTYLLIEYARSLPYQGGGADLLEILYFFLAIPSSLIVVMSFVLFRSGTSSDKDNEQR